MKMLSALQSPKSTAPDVVLGSEASANRRKPLQLLTGIFSRSKPRMRDGSGTPDSISGERSLFMSDNENTEHDHSFWGSLDVDPEDDLEIPEPREALHSPYHARTIDQDMENLRLSRQDNPYLQILASRECLHENDDCSDYEEAHLMSKENIGIGARDPLEIAEVHARLVRSPPPVMWTRSRNSDSEPSFSRLGCHRSNGDCVFQFPPVSGRLNLPSSSPSHSFRSQSATLKLLSPQEYHSRSKKSLEALTGKFNLSPQPRRRPAENNRSFSDYN